MQPYRADWRDPTKYPTKHCDDRMRLAWEFLRRNPEYAKHFAQMKLLADGEYEKGIRKKSTSVLDGLECWPPAEVGETAADYHVRVTDRAKGLRGRIDVPRNTFRNRWALKSPIHPDQNYDPDLVQFDPPRIALKRHGEMQTKSFDLFLYPNEVALRFRLDLRWAQQVAVAEKRFNEEAKNFRLALGNKDSEKTPSGQTLVSLATSRETKVEPNAHYWLRAYDALTKQKVLLGDEKRRRAFESGETEVSKFFAQEAKASKESPRIFERGFVDGCKNSANDYINGLKFLTLLTGKKQLESSNCKVPNITERDHVLRAIGSPAST